MNPATVSHAYSTTAIQKPQQKPETAEVQKTGPDHDNDSDDRAANTTQTQSVNSHGQSIGRFINVKA